MDWTNRGNRQTSAAEQPVQRAAGHGHPSPSRRRSSWERLKGMRLATFILLVATTILVVVLLWALAVGGNIAGEARYINKDRLQAVFLENGQVYFGNIKGLNNKYIRMTDIYYIRANNTESNSAEGISLVKLGCELHGPQDQMLINRDQVIFWENLKEDGQVAKAVADYVRQNPNGQQCQQPGQSGNNQPAPAPNGNQQDQEDQADDN